jgi:hypothetical protein
MGTDDEDFGKQLATRLDAMRKEFEPLKKTPSYVRLEGELPGAFQRLEDSTNGSSAPVPSQQHSLVDYDLCALRVVRDYIWLWEGSSDEAFHQKMTKIEPEILGHLSHKSWYELRRAALLLKQFRENSSEEDVRTPSRRARTRCSSSTSLEASSSLPASLPSTRGNWCSSARTSARAS